MKTRLIAMIGALLFSVPLSIAQHSISGTVKQSDGSPLAGAKVKLENTYKGCLAESDGTFKLTGLQDGKYQLLITFVGYESISEEVDITGKDVELNFVMKEAQYMTDKVIVTALKAGEKTPTTYTNIDKEEIEKKNFGQDIPFLFRSTPSTVVSSDAGAGVGYTGIRIRGVDPTRTNVTINGIPINDSESHGVYWVNMPDFASSVDNIQIQRGVGTSSNGAAAFGATINIETNDINKKAYGVLDNSYGSFNTLKNSLKVGSGLINDKFTFDMRLSNIQSDGYIDRASSNLKSLYSSVAWVGKKAMLKANVFMGRERTYQAWWGTPESVVFGTQEDVVAYADRNWIFGDDRDNLLNSGRTYNYYTYQNEVDNYGQDHYQLHFMQSISPNLNLSIAGHYTRGKGYYEQYKADDDLATYGLDSLFIGGDTITTTDIIRRRWLDNHFSGAVFALNYNNKKGFDFTWGGAGNAYTGLHYGEIIWSEFASNSQYQDKYYQTDAFKVDVSSYVKATYELKKFTFFGDVQIRYIDYQFEGVDESYGEIISLDQKVNYLFLNPKAGLMYDLNDKHNFYASYAMANREPTRGDFVESPPSQQPNPEQLHNIETGYRMKLKKAYLNANLYYMHYIDQLILTGQVNDVGSYTRTNVSRSYRAGLEIEGGVYLMKNLSLSGNFTYSMNKIPNFTEYVDDYDNGGQIEIQHTNTDLAFSPNMIASLGLDYEPIKNLHLTVLGKYVDDQYLDNTSNENRMIPSYFISNFRVDYTIKDKFFKEIVLGVAINNFTNTLYANNGYTWGYYYGGEYIQENFYYPQAGINWLGRVMLKL
ncbi:TonB-dependent receptor [Paracrocinitomix mangrovi]|uniref:TonB-dependent receptor n=1 Tax=Paracrocinitomix mangrovi TaxID=2862509 RepID=UPI001C8D940C|nr:TonB-dependent receptor [Paracrocinitomix mangrovi]UKN03576.1 TonB-dependent receptor [Paracrocinitomix mangrovi]